MIAQAPQLLENPCCDFINAFPWWFFLLVHVALFALGAFFAYRSFEADARGFGWGFTLFALAEVSYMTYHVNLTQFLFAHTVSEVLDGLAFVLLFAASLGRAGLGALDASGDVGGAR
jgi:tryptophan-rich sensory protein